jgi:hypothetical protein
MYAKFILISAVESFVLFPFIGDYLNLEILFLPNVSDVWKCPNPVKFPNVPFFITKSAVEPKNE